MQMRSPVLIGSVMKALGDVVLPAVDPQNKLAQEQLRLAMGLLTFLSQQMPLQFRYDCDELARLLEFSRELKALASGGADTSAALADLEETARSASRILEGARTSPDALESAIGTLRAASARVVTQVHIDGLPACRPRIGRCVLAMSREQLLRERSAVLMQNWEPDPRSVPPLATLLNGEPA